MARDPLREFPDPRVPRGRIRHVHHAHVIRRPHARAADAQFRDVPVPGRLAAEHARDLDAPPAPDEERLPLRRAALRKRPLHDPGDRVRVVRVHVVPERLEVRERLLQVADQARVPRRVRELPPVRFLVRRVLRRPLRELEMRRRQIDEVMDAKVGHQEVEREAQLHLVHELRGGRALVAAGLLHVALQRAHDDPVELLPDRDEGRRSQVEPPPVRDAERTVEARRLGALLEEAGDRPGVFRDSRQSGEIPAELRRALGRRRSAEARDAHRGGVTVLRMVRAERGGVERLHSWCRWSGHGLTFAAPGCGWGYCTCGGSGGSDVGGCVRRLRRETAARRTNGTTTATSISATSKSPPLPGAAFTISKASELTVGSCSMSLPPGKLNPMSRANPTYVAFRWAIAPTIPPWTCAYIVAVALSTVHADAHVRRPM